METGLPFHIRTLREEPTALYGDGSQTRSFCYADDFIEGMVRFMKTPSNFTGPVNMGNSGKFTLRELSEKAIALFGSRSLTMTPSSVAPASRWQKKGWIGKPKTP